MKKIILSLLILVSAKCFSQTDSNTVKINVTLKGKDLRYTGIYTKYSDDMENIYDTVKVKFRPPLAVPGDNANVTVSNVPIADWLAVMKRIRSDAIAIHAGVFDRVDIILRALNIPFLTAKLDAQKNLQAQIYNDNLNIGTFNYRKQ